MKNQTVAQEIWNYISKVVYNTEDIGIKTMLANTFTAYKTPEEITISLDYDEGAISNELEWTKDILKQLMESYDITIATGHQLDIYGDITRIHRKSIEKESDDDYRARMLLYLRPCGGGTKYNITSLLTDILGDKFLFIDISNTAFVGLSFIGVYDTSETCTGSYYETRRYTYATETYSERSGYYDLDEYAYLDHNTLTVL